MSNDQKRENDEKIAFRSQKMSKHNQFDIKLHIKSKCTIHGMLQDLNQQQTIENDSENFQIFFGNLRLYFVTFSVEITGSLGHVYI